MLNLPRAFVIALFASASALEAQVTVTGPSNGANCFPFGCARGGTRYQQVYTATAFTGPISIGAVTFFTATPGALSIGAFDIYLSTTAAAVDGLSSTFNSNLGSPTTFFGSYVLGGATSGDLTFAGTPYFYDPTAGNLLFDLRVTSTFSGGSSNFVARNNALGGNYSRQHDWGVGFAGYGLDTRFEEAAVTVPEPASLALVATGLLAFGGFARRRRFTA